MPSLTGDYTAFRAETKRLSAILESTDALAPTHRKFVAEIALLRLAILIENSMQSLFCKLICGASYLDGSAPIILKQRRNVPAAVSAMHDHGRAKSRRTLHWNDGKEIRENIKFLIDPNDRCHLNLITHASFLTDIRYIRNHIAHRNDNSRVNFMKLILRYYGARVPGVTCGNLLVSTRVSSARPLLATHIINANVMMKDIARG